MVYDLSKGEVYTRTAYIDLNANDGVTGSSTRGVNIAGGSTPFAVLNTGNKPEYCVGIQLGAATVFQSGVGNSGVLYFQMRVQPISIYDAGTPTDSVTVPTQLFEFVPEGSPYTATDFNAVNLSTRAGFHPLHLLVQGFRFDNWRAWCGPGLNYGVNADIEFSFAATFYRPKEGKASKFVPHEDFGEFLT